MIKIYRKYIKNGASPEDEFILENCESDIRSRILTAKEAYLKQQGSKASIPPLFVEGNFITNCKEKASTFNTYFSAQCTLFQIRFFF